MKKFLYVFILLVSISSLKAETFGGPLTNKFAWKASLEIINFMPLASADPFSGVIITDWYNVTPTEQYKINVYILEGILSSNTVKVKVFKRKQAGSSWVNEQISDDVTQKLENTILNRARELRALTNGISGE